MVVVSTITSQENLGFESTGKSFCVVFACSACPSPGTPGSSHSHGRCVMLIVILHFCVVVCVSVLALWLDGDLSGVYHTSSPLCQLG